MNYPELFRPILIGSTLFRNRIFSAPTGHPDVTIEGNFSEDVTSYYERKAMGGAACVTLGEAIVDSRYGKRHPFQVSLDCRHSIHSLAKIADAIRRHGAVASIELQHSGMKATPGLDTPGVCKGADIIYGPSACEHEGHPVVEMPEEIIYEIIDKYANAAAQVQEAGFGMVTIHAGHGWLLNQFMSPLVNKRTDRWGGSAENRARFTVEVCDAIHKKCGRGFPVEVRISASEVVEGGYTVEEGAAFAKALERHADIIHCSVGCGINVAEGYRTFPITHPSMFFSDGPNVKYAAEVKKHLPNTPVATVGALDDPALMEEILASGKADIVEMARGLICDPDFPNKVRDGREAEIIRCMRCMTCFSSLKSRGAFWCALNPMTNRERPLGRLAQLPVSPKKVLVAGGGVAGMQAALTAAENGHQVILCEKSGRLGGHIRCEENVPFKKHLGEYIAQQERRVAEAGIDVRLNTEVTPEYAKSLGADAVIAALGARAFKPPIPGIDGKNVLCADDAYRNPAQVGDSAVILGGGLVGMELAIYLTSLGKKAEVVEMAPAFNPGFNFLHGQCVSIKLREEGIPCHFSTRAESIDEGGVHCSTPEGEQYFAADTVIYAVGQKPLTAETIALSDCAARFYPVGDCAAPRTIADANMEARTVALDIGR